MKTLSMAVCEFRPNLVGNLTVPQDYKSVIQHQVGSFFYYLYMYVCIVCIY